MILNGIGASDGLGLGNAVCIRESVLDYTGVIYAGAEAEKRACWRLSMRFAVTPNA